MIPQLQLKAKYKCITCGEKAIAFINKKPYCSHHFERKRCSLKAERRLKI